MKGKRNASGNKASRLQSRKGRDTTEGNASVPEAGTGSGADVQERMVADSADVHPDGTTGISGSAYTSLGRRDPNERSAWGIDLAAVTKLLEHIKPTLPVTMDDCLELYQLLKPIVPKPYMLDVQCYRKGIVVAIYHHTGCVLSRLYARELFAIDA